jgi:hypothetical protein
VDADLVAYLDRRFAEVRGDIATSGAALRDESRAGLATLRDELRADLAASAAVLRSDLAATADRLRAEIAAETTRHIDVVIEALVSKMELVVEGVRTVDQRLDRFSDEVRGDFQKVDRRLLRLHARIGSRRRRRRGH